MEHYKDPEIPEYQDGLSGLVACLGQFLERNYPHLHFSKHTTKKGSIGYVAHYKEDSSISLFAYQDEAQINIAELYWQERNPSKRHVSIKMPIAGVTDYENSMAFIAGVFPILSDGTIDHAEMSNEDMEENLRELIIQADLHGAQLSVVGYRGIEDEELPGERNPEYHEIEMDNSEILDLIDKSLDKRDFGEVARLRGLLKEGINKFYGLRHLKDFKNF